MDYSSGRAHGCRLTQFSHRSLTHLALENDLHLVPWTSFPMNHDAAVAAGAALKLPGSGRVRTTFTATSFEGRDRVARITAEGAVE